MAEIIRINDGTWRIEDGNVRFFLLCGTSGAMLIDSGMNTPDARVIAESLTSLPLSLLNTHADPDHISGNRAFSSFYMSPAEEDLYRVQGGTGEILPVREGDVIDLGDRPLRIIDNPGHTRGSIAVLDEKNRVLIGGDAIQDGTIYMFRAHRNMQNYIKSLQHLLTYWDQFDVVYPSHGTFPVYPDLILKLIEGAQEILDGKAQGEDVEVHGMPARLYRFPYAGFYCERK